MLTDTRLRHLKPLNMSNDVLADAMGGTSDC